MGITQIFNLEGSSTPCPFNKTTPASFYLGPMTSVALESRFTEPRTGFFLWRKPEIHPESNWFPLLEPCRYYIRGWVYLTKQGAAAHEVHIFGCIYC